MRNWILLLACTCLVQAKPVERLKPTAGVKLAKVIARVSETQADPLLEQAITRELKPAAGEEIRYLYNRVDLNGQKSQTIVMLLSRDYWGSGGGTALVFDKQGDKYRLVSQLSPVRPPILVQDQSSKGWKNLVTLVQGGGASAHYTTLKYDGKAYPGNPTIASDTAAGTILYGNAVVSDPIGPQSGLRFKVR